MCVYVRFKRLPDFIRGEYLFDIYVCNTRYWIIFEYEDLSGERRCFNGNKVFYH